MTPLQTLSARLAEAASSPVPLLLAKITLLLAVAWLLHATLSRQNPRWRVLVWRLAAIGCVLLAGLTACPPLFEWAVLPELVASEGAAVAENLSPTASEVAPRSTLAPARVVAAEQGRGAVPRPAPTDFAEPDPAVAPSPPDKRSRTAASQPAPQADGRPADHGWAWWAMLVWCGGLAALALRTMLGTLRVRAICRRAAPVDGEVANRAVQIACELGICSAAGATGGGRRDVCPTIRQSTDVPTPCLVGLWRPTILLPASSRHALNRDELTAVLAHELAHVQGRDLLWNAVLHALGHVLWFHPLAWRIRATHAADCDAVCDSIAADYLGDTDRYTRTLARLAVRLASPVTTPGLTMARTSNARRRIESLKQDGVRPELPRHRILALAFLVVSLVVLLGSTTLARAEEEAAHLGASADSPPQVETPLGTDASESIAHTIIHAVQKDSEKPLQGVRIRFEANIDGALQHQEAQTDEHGLAVVQWQSGRAMNHLSMSAEKNGFVPIEYLWTRNQRSLELPTRLDLPFETGRLIGGIVQDEVGQPVGGVSVRIVLPNTGPEPGSYAFVAAELTTNAEGEWEWPNAPADLTDVSTRIDHPPYLLARGKLNPGLDNVTILRRGLELAGRVRDTGGEPIATARVSVDQRGAGPSQVLTDATGRFVLYRRSQGRAVVTVQADGFASQVKEIEIGREVKQLDFQLKPGRTLRVRVVDERGRPIEGATVAIAGWPHYGTVSFSAETDAEGRVEWNSAPPDEVSYDVTKAGYLAIRQLPLTASSEDQIVRLHRELVIEGNVTDAVTGRPIPSFEIEHGVIRSPGRVSWYGDEPAAYVEGAYRFRIRHFSEGYRLRVTAHGYRPAESRTFEPNEGRQTFDFKLQPAKGVVGFVLLPDGNPAGGAEVALATRERNAMPTNGYFDRRQNRAPVVTTDSDGRFELPPLSVNEPYALIVLHESGYGDATREAFQQSGRIRLQPWGRIEGKVLVGTDPDADRGVRYLPNYQEVQSFIFAGGYQAKTAADGTFALDRVKPGAGNIFRVLVTEFPRGSFHTGAWQVPITVQAGDTEYVHIGGTGRPVTGQIEVEGDPAPQVDWSANEPIVAEAWHAEEGRRTNPSRRYVAHLDATGRFRIPDVPAGDYRLTLTLNGPREPDTSDFGKPIAEAVIDFTVPEMPGERSDEPLNLGVITAKLLD